MEESKNMDIDEDALGEIRDGLNDIGDELSGIRTQLKALSCIGDSLLDLRVTCPEEVKNPSDRSRRRKYALIARVARSSSNEA